MAGQSETDGLVYVLLRLLVEERDKLSTYIQNSHRELAARLQEQVREAGRCHSLVTPDEVLQKVCCCEAALLKEPTLQRDLTWARVLQPSSARDDVGMVPFGSEFEQASSPGELVSHGPAPEEVESQPRQGADELSVREEAGSDSNHSDIVLEEVAPSAGADFKDGQPTHRTASMDAIGAALESIIQTCTLGREKKEIKIREVAKHKNMSKAKSIITHPLFELAFAIMIFCNALCMAVEQQYEGIDCGYKLQLGGFQRSAEDTWQNAESWFLVFETFFGCIFTMEVTVKLCVFGREFWSSPWNDYDLVIVACWLIQNLDMISSVGLPPLVLRLARLGRLLRLLRFAKTFQVFDVLRLLVRSMEACLTALMWSAMCVLLVMMGTTILMVSLLQEEINNEQIPFEARQDLYLYFGTFTRGFLSLFELTMGNWVPIARTMVEHVSEWYMVFIIVYRTLVGFAVLKVVTAIFNAETFRVTQTDDDVMIMHKERAIAIHTRRMQQLLLEGDASQDGYLTISEFSDLMADNGVRKWLAAQEIEFKDIEVAFALIDTSKDGRINAEELVRGLAALKGPAKSVDVLTMMHALTRIENQGLRQGRLSSSSGSEDNVALSGRQEFGMPLRYLKKGKLGSLSSHSVGDG
eukprot:TRINITY_DN7787_c0_g2_i1.p1 TRINITY_DN7787_c0_g2~~TRINITY_DN7787_c0_g2_i1.p1  ORF type:complete len:677 (-),score=117.39 TRINITY_DN7787_c0_g2_i1:416-2329(-)